MKRMSVYRVEHLATGDGPFSGRCPAHVRDDLSDHCGRRDAFLPEAHLDCDRFEPGYHVCGVATLSGIEAWFGPFRQLLLEAGFVLMEYEPLPSNVCSSPSEHQVGFPKYEATPRRQLPWPEVEVLDPKQLALFA